MTDAKKIHHRKGKVPVSTENRTWYNFVTQWIFEINYKYNDYLLKGEITKRGLCIYLVQTNIWFRRLWEDTHPNKAYPTKTSELKALGLRVYKNIISDKRASNKWHGLTVTAIIEGVGLKFDKKGMLDINLIKYKKKQKENPGLEALLNYIWKYLDPKIIKK
ncbi:MAG TPA: hypothetical protein DHV86_08285 [Methylophilaceae bacterium]|jgi:hypothetical protein|nr:hypothetical protein [Methylophilaceae bacterium]